MFGRGRRKRSAPGPGPGPATVEVDDEGVTFHRGQTTEAVRWSDLTGVDVMTTSDGPVAGDVFLVLHGASGEGAVIPQELVPEALQERVMALPGFDYEAMIEAMGSTADKTFTCWRAPS